MKLVSNEPKYFSRFVDKAAAQNLLHTLVMIMPGFVAKRIRDLSK